MLLWLIATVWAQEPAVDTDTDAGEDAAPAEAAPAAPPSSCPADGVYPGEAWSRDEAWAPGRPDAVAALEATLFPPDLDWQDKDRRGIRTEGVVIVHRGDIVYERYGPGWTADMPHLTWSVAKSFTNALVGLAVGDGLVDVDDSICTHLDGLPAPSCAVTLDHVLMFGSGFDWQEVYEDGGPRSSSVLAMLYGEGREDMARFVASHPLRDPPGTTFSYSSGDTNVASAIAGRHLAAQDGERFPWVRLFEPLGITSATWQRDGVGTYVGSSDLHITPRDQARFGWFLLQDGCWQGERLLPEGWVDFSTEINPAILSKDLDKWGVQGRQFWVNGEMPERGRPWPQLPPDAFAALGHWKQAIYVIPSAELVMVRTGDDRASDYQHGRVMKLALDLVEGR